MTLKGSRWAPVPDVLALFSICFYPKMTKHCQWGKFLILQYPIPKGLDHIGEHAYYILEEHKEVKALMGPHWKTSPQRDGPEVAMVPASKLSSYAQPQNKQPVGWPRNARTEARAPAVRRSRSVFKEETLGELDKAFVKLGSPVLSSPFLSLLLFFLPLCAKKLKWLWPHLLLGLFLKVSKVNGLFAPFLDFHNKCKWWALTRKVKPEQEFSFSYSFN